ncbi:MAG: hypothetical protein N2C12_11145 [Planctomycetales bacterium]
MILSSLTIFAFGPASWAQEAEPDPYYQPSCQIYYQQIPQHTCRVQGSLVYQRRVMTTYQPVWETVMRECRYSVARPVTQTVEREEKYVVLNPVWETQIRDESYDVVKNVVETGQREQLCTVNRFECQVQQRTQTHQVRRYVMRTVQRSVPRVSYTPVNTQRTIYVDRGRYVQRQVQRPGWSLSALRWTNGGWVANPDNGRRRYLLPGLAWDKQPAPTRTVTRRVWEPNQVAIQVPHASYRRVVRNETVQSQVGEWVVENVTRQVPVCVRKLVTEQRTCKVPYVTTRQVVQRVEKKVPVRVCKYVRAERVRKVPTTYTRMVYKQCVRQVPVRVCKMVPVKKIIYVPRCVQSLVPVQRPCCMPCTAIIQIPNSAVRPTVIASMSELAVN